MTSKWLKFDHIFISACKLQFLFVFQFFVPKTYVLKVLYWALFFWTLWLFCLQLPNFKMTSVTLNTSFYINLKRFVDD